MTNLKDMKTLLSNCKLVIHDDILQSLQADSTFGNMAVHVAIWQYMMQTDIECGNLIVHVKN